jgi:hypothetical protein
MYLLTIIGQIVLFQEFDKSREKTKNKVHVYIFNTRNQNRAQGLRIDHQIG